MSVSGPAELWQMSATELAGVIRAKQASSREVLEAHLRRIAEANPAVNAVPVVLAKQALAAASAADHATAGGEELPPLHGVPFTIKANIDVAGTPTTAGTEGAARTPIRPADAPGVQRMRAAGAIPIGRTNLPNIAVRWHTDSELWGATVNPWDRRRTPGASSGGEAAALATGMSPLGLGSDGLGSLRWPAQCCGVSALKPTLGRIPDATSVRGGARPDRHPADRRRRAAGAAGRRPSRRIRGDGRTQLARPVDGAGTAARPAPATPLRVALVIDPAGRGTATQVRDGVRNAAEPWQTPAT